MRLVQTTKPTKLAVSLADAKEHCRIADLNTHDALITRLIISATEMVESRTGLRLASRTMRLELDGFPSGDIEIPVYPVTAITAFVYDDVDGTETTLTEDTGSPSANDDYWPQLDGACPYIRSSTGAWPVAQVNKPNSVRVTLTVGYSDTSDIPEDLRHAIMIKVKELFDHGGETINGVSVEDSANTVAYLIAPYRKYDV